MIDIYSALDISKVEQGWQPTKHSVNERKPSNLSIGDLIEMQSNLNPIDLPTYGELPLGCKSRYFLPSILTS